MIQIDTEFSNSLLKLVDGSLPIVADASPEALLSINTVNVLKKI